MRRAGTGRLVGRAEPWRKGGTRRAFCPVGNRVQQQTVGCPRSQDTASALSVDFGFGVPSWRPHCAPSLTAPPEAHPHLHGAPASCPAPWWHVATPPALAFGVGSSSGWSPALGTWGRSTGRPGQAPLRGEAAQSLQFGNQEASTSCKFCVTWFGVVFLLTPFRQKHRELYRPNSALGDSTGPG